MKRTTIRMDEYLLAEAKRYAAETGRSLTTLIQDSLRQTLADRPSSSREAPVELPVSRGGRGLQPGVDLDNSADLLDLMGS